jgi:tetratricopeptide (TPR) repeat protein/V8-like Glu-specific endopeptidase
MLGVGLCLVSTQSIALAKSPTEVNQIAQSITVKVEEGSGILIKREGDLYTVLTAAHVTFDEFSGESNVRTITTFDEKQHQVIGGSVQKLSSEVDLSTIQFRSTNKYQVAEFGDSNKLEGGTEVYVAGFPVPTSVITERIFVFRRGLVSANSTKVLRGGYGLLYDNSTLPGMSGGPLLNEQGQLVGLHGKGDQDDQGKTGFNAGIPISRFVDLAKKAKTNMDLVGNLVPTQFNPLPEADDFLIAATEKWGKKDFQGALVDIDQAIRLNPNSASSYSRRGAIKLALKRVPEALADYNRAIGLNPRFAMAYNNRGLLKVDHLNDAPGALADYDLAILLNPQFAFAHNNRGLLKENSLNDAQGALADYNRAITLNSQYAAAYYNRGILKDEKLNDISGSLADHDKAIALNSQLTEAYNSRGLVKTKLQDFQGALADYSKAIELNPQYAFSFHNRGVLKVRNLADYTGAVSDLRNAAVLHRSQGNTKLLNQTIEELRKLGAENP